VRILLAPGRLPVCGGARVSRRVAGSRRRLVQLGRARLFLRAARVRGRTRSREPPPVDIEFRGFWVIAIAAALSFYWTLQSWHRKLEWGPGSR